MSEIWERDRTQLFPSGDFQNESSMFKSHSAPAFYLIALVGISCVQCVTNQASWAQSTVDFPIGCHVNVLSDYKETGPEKNCTF